LNPGHKVELPARTVSNFKVVGRETRDGYTD
jgi:hypothetical protein